MTSAKKSPLIHTADAVIIGSYVPRAIEVAKWVFEHAEGIVAFYDIDTPVTLSKLEASDYEYIDPGPPSQSTTSISPSLAAPRSRALRKNIKQRKPSHSTAPSSPKIIFPKNAFQNGISAISAPTAPIVNPA
jgi:hypothetical protein